MLALLPLAAQADAVETGFNQPNDLYTTIDLGSIYMNYGDCAKVTWLQMQSQVLANIGNYGITKSQFENSYYLEVVGGYGNLPYVQSTNVAPSGALYDNAAANSWWAVRYAIDANGNYVLAQNSQNDDNLSRLSSYTADNNWFGRVWYNPIGNTDDSTNALLWQFDNTDANASNMTTSAYEKMVTAAGVSYSSVGRNTKAFSTVVRFISRNDGTSIWVKLVLPVGNINFACGDIKGRDLSKWFDYKQGYHNGTDTIEVYANVPTPAEVNQQALTVTSFQKDLKEYWMSNQVGLNFNNAVKFNKFTAEGSLSTTFQFRLPKSGENTVDIDADANGEWTVDGLSGNTYTLYLKNNKSEIWAKSNANAGMSGDELICTLTADGIITYKGGSSYGAANDILNLIGIYDATGKYQENVYLTGHNRRTFAAYVEIKVTGDNYAPIMGKNYFNVRFLRPINVWPAEQEVTAAMNHTEFFNIWEFLYIRDWREYPVVMDGQRQKFGDRYKEGTGLDGKTYRGLGDGSWPYSFYDISNLYVLRNEIRSDAYKAPTDRTKLTDPAMIMELRTVDQIPALTSGNTQFLKIISKNQANDNYSVAGTAGKTASSQTDDVLAYTNNGGTVKPFHIYVPIAVEYPWGTQNTHTQKVWAVITISSESPEETIDFADANVKTLCVANWDTNSDGELSQAEAAAVTDLGEVFKNNPNITSFGELQYFSGLTGISANAFNGCFNLQSVTLPHGVTSIGDRAFSNCSRLESILIPKSVTSISFSSFINCRSLTSMTVENGNTVYDSRENCNAIIETATNELVTGCKNTVVPNTVTSIASYAFFGCTGLTSLTIPGSVTSIDANAFFNCSGLTSVTIPNSVTFIGNNAFGECTGLTSVIVENPEPVAIYPNTFTNRANATLCVPAGAKTAYAAADYWKDFKGIVEASTSLCITFADANAKAICVANWDTNGDGELSEAEAAVVTDLGEVFKNNPNITSFDELQYFPELTGISANAFSGCSNLQSVTLPHGVTSIGNRAFMNCSSLESILIPNSVTSIGQGVFQDCSGLTSMTVENGNTVYDSRENCNAIIETATNTLIAGCKNTVIPNTVTSIGEAAFTGCTGLTSVTIPGTVTSIGRFAFNGCSGLTNVTIPGSVTSIGVRAFYGCTGLTYVTVGNPTPVAITEDAFSNRGNITLCVPAGAKTAYAAADYWKDFKGIVETGPSPIIPFVDANVKAICVENWDVDGNGELSEAEAAAVKDLGSVFKNNKDIITFDELQYFSGLTRISGHAFDGCSNLQSVTLPHGLTSVGNSAFSYCSALASVTIPNSVTSVGSSAFSYCSSLTSIVVESGNTVYDSRENCNAIIKTATNELVAGCNSTVIPAGVTSIAEFAFMGCTGLTSVTIPAGVTSVGMSAFAACPGLTSVIIPVSVTSIGGSAFYNCSGLTSVTVESPEPIAINASVFSNRANATLYVPAGAKAAYEAANYWKEFMEIVEVGVTTTDISQMDNVIYIEDTEVRTGSEKTLSVKMKNTAPIRGFQFDLYLPDGVTVVKSDNGRIQGALTPGRLPEGDAHTLTFSEHEGGFVRFLCSSLYDETFTGSDGEIATLKVTVSADMAEGDYAIQMKDVKLTETNIDNYYLTDVVQSKLTVMSYVVGDITGNGTVDVSDYTGVANHIHGNTPNNFNAKAADVNSDGSVDVSDYTGIANIIHTGNIHGNTNSNSARSMDMSDIAGETTASEVTDVTGIDNVIYVEPFTAAKGSQTTISIKMKNTAEIRGFQFDLYLPEGMTAVKYSNGRIQGALTPARLPEYDQHDLTFSEHEGYVRFLCSSQYMETFTGNDGEIATLQVQVADDMEPGDYDVKLTKIKLTENDIDKYYETAQVNTTVTITEAAYTVLDETSTTVPEATSSPVDIKVKRTLKGGEWSTICLPFAMTEAQVKEAFGSDVQLGDFTGCETTMDAQGENVVAIQVNFDKSVTAIEANHPYIIKVSSDISEFTVDDVDIAPTEELSVDRDNTRVKVGSKWFDLYNSFVGTYVAQTTVPENCLFLSGNKFWYSTGQTKMKAFRGYFDFMDVLSSLDAASARINLSFNGSETTGIRINDNDNVNDNYYDLQGRRVEKPTRGLYIKGNKKVFVK